MDEGYVLCCSGCGRSLDDDGAINACPEQHEPALLRSVFARRQLAPDESAEGIFRYTCWLPVRRALAGSGRTVIYRSEGLSARTRLPNLWIAFNGYWPERGAMLATATFKELEAFTVLARRAPNDGRVLVVASAGNTAAAFARACSMHQVPCLVIVPEMGLRRMQFAERLAPCVKIVSLVGFTDYYDAITLADRVAERDGFVAEGGVRNVARRDGMATVLLSAVEAIGRLPDYYFQAVGSGAGAIATHESAQRLVADGRFGAKLPRLMLSQNLPFIPIYLSWKSQRRELLPISRDDGKKQIRQIVAQVLSNRSPPYGVQGGVYDVLTESQGDVLVADNEEAIAAGRLFEELEGNDVDAAGAVALATLLKAADHGRVEPEATVLLNLTGGGWYRAGQERRLIPAKPSLQLDEREVFAKGTVDRVARLFRAAP